jgi:hypothetical protein
LSEFDSKSLSDALEKENELIKQFKDKLEMKERDRQSGNL